MVHAHRCPKCGRTWEHEQNLLWTADEFTQAHTCTSCKTETYDKHWQPHCQAPKYEGGLLGLPLATEVAYLLNALLQGRVAGR